jgi:hypothetical protein
MNKTWSILRPEDALETYKSFVYQSFGNSDFEIIENVEMIDLIHPNKNAFDILLMKEITNLKDFFKHINYDYSILDMNRRHSLQTVRKYQDYVNNRRNKEFFGVCEYSDTVSSNQPSRNKKGKKVNKKQHKNEDEEAETNPKASSLEDYMRHYQIEEYDTHNDPKRLSYQVM